MRRIKSFDGLRGIFAILIFLNHCSFMKDFGEKCEKIFETIFHNGSFCVLFFFLLSGFCIYTGYENKFDHITKNNYMTFLKRRVNKLYFPYIISMIWAMLYRCIVLGESVKKNFLKLLLSATMLQTLDIKHWDVLNSAAWFVSCIWIIYLFTPFLIQGLKKLNSVSKLFCIMFVLYFGRITLHFLFINMTLPFMAAELAEYVWPFVRIFDFSMGLALGAIVSKIKYRYEEKSLLLPELFAVSLVIIAWFTSLNGLQWLKSNAIVYSIPVLLFLIYIFSRDEGPISAFLSQKAFSSLGKNSMGIYLFHYVVIWSGGWMVIQKYIYRHINYHIPFLLVIIITLFWITYGIAVIVNLFEKKLSDMRRKKVEKNRIQI